MPDACISLFFFFSLCYDDIFGSVENRHQLSQTYVEISLQGFLQVELPQDPLRLEQQA